MSICSSKIRIGVAILAVVIVAGVVGLLVGRSMNGKTEIGGSPREADAVSLASPALAASAEANFLVQEAGISLYFNAAKALNLSTARTVYRTVEIETSNYIIGSIALPGRPESDDVHCYVHKDGWIVVYYLKAEPVSKIIDWQYYSSYKLTTDSLRVAMNLMCSSLSLSPTGLGYYHWHYPDAKNLMIITESTPYNSSDSFNLNIPAAFTVYERSWSHQASGGIARGVLTLAQLMPDMLHVVEADGGYYGGLNIDGTSISSILTASTRFVAIVLVYNET